jgi:hypothetical protein
VIGVEINVTGSREKRMRSDSISTTGLAEFSRLNHFVFPRPELE